MRTIQRNIAGAIILSADDAILHGKQAAGTGVYPGCWIIPGGGIDEDETPQEAIIRELKEETGLDVSPYPLELISDTRTATTEKTIRGTGEKVLCDMRFFDFRIVIPLPSAEILVHPSDDLIELKWIPIGELASHPLPPPSVELFKQLGYLS